MSAAVQQLLADFARLTEAEQHEAACEILRRVFPDDLPPLDDETINRIAEEAFLAYDAEEAADAESRAG